MPNLLIVAYYFPPLGGAGVQRTLKFVKYLPDFGWRPVVLSVQTEHGLQPTAGSQQTAGTNFAHSGRGSLRTDRTTSAERPSARLTDVSLEADIPTGLALYRTAAPSLPHRLPFRLRRWISRWLLLVDEQIGWLPFAVQRGLQIARQVKIDAIYTTSAPYTAHLIGQRLHQATRLPWIADFRDPWVDNFASPFPSPLHARFARRLEHDVVVRSSAVTVVTQPMQTAFEARYADIPPGKIHLVPNGFDPDDFQDGVPGETPSALRPADRPKDCFLIVYTGMFYGQRQPEHFFKALRVLVDRRLVSPETFRVRLVGRMGREIVHQIEAAGLTDLVELTGYLPHRQSIANLLTADALLLIVGAGPGSDNIMTGKIFEYLAAQKPILALSAPSAAAQLIHQAQAGLIAAPTDIEAIAAAILTLYQRWQRGEPLLFQPPNAELLKRYHRRTLTGQLAAILETAL